MEKYADLIILLLIFAVVLISFLKSRPAFEDFKSGAEEGIKTALRLLPTLIGIICAVNLLSASGFTEMLAYFLKPLTDAAGIHGDLITLILTKPISGSASTGIVTDIFTKYGPDSAIGKMASVMAASTETTFYAISVYLSGKDMKNLRYTVPAALMCDFITVFLSIFLVNSGL